MNIQEYRKLKPKTKKSKYNSTKTDGYDSRKEAQRAATLKLMEKGGLISDLMEQSKFELIPSQYGLIDGKYKCVERACTYIADFTYYKKDPNGDIFIVEDCKGMKTEVYRIKKKLMLHVHGIRITES